MAEMNRLGRWLVNRANPARSARILDTLAPFLALPPRPRVLEIGTGAGGLSALVLERFRPGRMVATDVDPAQIEAARRALVARYGAVPSELELRLADALELPFEGRSFDAVFAIHVFHHVEARASEFVRRPEAAREVLRVLRPGGLLAYAEFSQRAALRDCLASLGFATVNRRSRWGHDLAVLRAPS